MSYALLLEEGEEGYVFYQELKRYFERTVWLVYSVSTHEFCKRKYIENRPQSICIGGLPNEVRFSAPRLKTPCFPELLAWNNHGTYTVDVHSEDFSTKVEVCRGSMIFRRYNGRDLSALAERYLEAMPEDVAKDLESARKNPVKYLKQDLFKHANEHWPVPEGFLWHYIKSISYAIAYLQTGYTREDGIDRDWDPIVHQDNFPDNNFLHYEGDDLGFPRITLGDFGQASALSDEDFSHFRGRDTCYPDDSPRELWGDIVGIGYNLSDLIGIDVRGRSKAWDAQFEIIGRHYSEELRHWIKTLYWSEFERRGDK